MGFDGLLDLIELVFAAFDVFIMNAFHLNALGEVFLIKALVDFGQQILNAAKAGEALDVFGQQMADFGFVEAVVARAALVPFEKAEALV